MLTVVIPFRLSSQALIWRVALLQDMYNYNYLPLKVANNTLTGSHSIKKHAS